MGPKDDDLRPKTPYRTSLVNTSWVGRGGKNCSSATMFGGMLLVLGRRGKDFKSSFSDKETCLNEMEHCCCIARHERCFVFTKLRFRSSRPNAGRIRLWL